MKNSLKKSITIFSLAIALLLGNNVMAQAACCSTSSTKSKEKTACCSSNASEGTSGCTPSNCRGAKTKFGEAKAITELRGNLISLKAKLEKSEHPKFDKRTYDIHGIVGESDEASIAIIRNEVYLIEQVFNNKYDHFQADELVLPASKSKQVQYLSERISQISAQL